MKLFRAVLALVLVCVLVVAGAQWLNDPSLRRFGQVIVQAGGNDYVATLPKAGLLLLIAALLLWLLWTLLAAPFRVWLRFRRKQARARLIDGLTALHHGRWLTGEKLLLSAADEAEVGPVALAAALRAADKRGDETAAARHLQRLQEIDPLRHALLQARRLLLRGQAEDALALLDNPVLQPLPPRGQVLRQRALSAAGRADEAYGLLGALRSQQALPAEQLTALEAPLASQMLLQASDLTTLAERWEALAKPLRQDPQVAAAYARQANALGWPEPAARALEHALEAQWSPQLLPLLDEIDAGGDPDAMTARLQRLLQQHPDDPQLLLSAGQIARKQQQWPRAHELLLQAIAADAGSPAWEALGQAYAEQGLHAQASTSLLNALRLRRGQPLLPLEGGNTALPADESDTAVEQRDAHGLPRLDGPQA